MPAEAGFFQGACLGWLSAVCTQREYRVNYHHGWTSIDDATCQLSSFDEMTLAPVPAVLTRLTNANTTRSCFKSFAAVVGSRAGAGLCFGASRRRAPRWRYVQRARRAFSGAERQRGEPTRCKQRRKCEPRHEHQLEHEHRHPSRWLSA